MVVDVNARECTPDTHTVSVRTTFTLGFDDFFFFQKKSTNATDISIMNFMFFIDANNRFATHLQATITLLFAFNIYEWGDFSFKIEAKMIVIYFNYIFSGLAFNF